MGVWLDTASIAPDRELALIRALVSATREGNLDKEIFAVRDKPEIERKLRLLAEYPNELEQSTSTTR